MTEEQQIKLAILAIAEVLEVELPEKRLKLYYSALKDIGSAGLQSALAAVLADPDLRPGTMILPGKIRELALGSVDDEADAIVEDILRCVDSRVTSASWNAIGYQVAMSYGLTTLRERRTDQVPTIMAQLRSLVRSALSRHRREKAERTMLPSFNGMSSIAGVLESLKIGQEEGDAS